MSLVYNRSAFNRQPPLSSGCEVCVAARRLQQAQDDMNTFLSMGGVAIRKDPRTRALQAAQEVWNYSKNGRHTGPTHTPEVVK